MQIIPQCRFQTSTLYLYDTLNSTTTMTWHLVTIIHLNWHLKRSTMQQVQDVKARRFYVPLNKEANRTRLHSPSNSE